MLNLVFLHPSSTRQFCLQQYVVMSFIGIPGSHEVKSSDKTYKEQPDLPSLNCR